MAKVRVEQLVPQTDRLSTPGRIYGTRFQQTGIKIIRKVVEKGLKNSAK